MEAVHAINQLESGGCRKCRRGAEILLVPIDWERVEGPVTMVLGCGAALLANAVSVILEAASTSPLQQTRR